MYGVQPTKTWGVQRLAWQGMALSLLAALLLAEAPLTTLQAAAAATFTLNVKSAYLRDVPDPAAERTYSVFQGKTYPITGRTADSSWVMLSYAGATRGTWILAGLGTITGKLADVPVTAAAPTGGAAAVVPTTPPAAAAGGNAAAAVSGAVIGPGSQKLTITARSTYVRDAPNWQARKLSSLFQGALVEAIGRDGTGGWLQVVAGGPFWVPAGAGTLSGKLMALPVAYDVAPSAPAPALAATPAAPLPPWIPTISPAMRTMFQQTGRSGRNPRMFTVAGDCNSEYYLYLQPVAAGMVNLTGNEYLQATIEQFKDSFYRTSIAVNGGFNTASVLEPLWADPNRCRPGESPFACELRVSRASIVFILLGTGDQFTWQNFEGNYRKLIDYSLRNGVVPVVVTKADALESLEGKAEDDYINNTIRRLAAEYGVPLLDFALAVRTLPNNGLLEEEGNDFHLSGDGVTMHIMATLQTLNAIWGP